MVSERTRIILIFVLFAFFSGCGRVAKVKIEFNRLPLVADLSQKVLLLGAFHSNCELFDASRDIESSFLKKMKKETLFKEIIEFKKDQMPLGKDQTFDQFAENMGSFDWKAWNTLNNGDLLIWGSILFETDDHSGYDSVWAVNRYGERVPQKVWMDRLGYVYKLRILVVDLRENKILLDKVMDAKETIEGAADEVAVFMELTDIKTDEFMDILRGEKITTKRYLLKG
jgi:hypothetical protein